jgi:hypothetical protein
MLGLFPYAVTYQKTAVTLALSFFYLAGTAHATSLVVGDMTEVDWAAISVSNTNLATEVKMMVATGGNPGSHWQLGVSKSSYTSPVESDGFRYGPGATLALIYQAAVWNPATDGVLTSLNIGFDVMSLQSSFASNDSGFMSAAIQQNGKVYYLIDGFLSINQNNWTALSFTGLDNTKWLSFENGQFGTDHPDFSNGLLRFGVGYSFYNNCFVSCDGFNGKVAVDNFSVSVNGVAPTAISPVPAPTAIWLYATGLPFLGAVMRRRRRVA